ncbi:MAG: hypothetical protein RR197_05055 [Oscillospiraceae bacterium]
MGYPASSMPEDLKMECVYICRGYRRRKRALARRLLSIAQDAPAAARYRADPEVQKLLAVQAALDAYPEDGALLLDSITGQIPYEHLDPPMCRQLFYHRRREFLQTVARTLGYWH